MENLSDHRENRLNNPNNWGKEKLNYINTIESLNQKLNELLWLHSNLVNDPIVRITRMLRLIQENKENAIEKETMLKYLFSTVKELEWALKYVKDKNREANL